VLEDRSERTSTLITSQVPVTGWHELIGKRVRLEAELERDGRQIVVVGLAGCAHADGFGEAAVLMLAEECRLIEAAIEAVEAATSGRRSG
jgi:hypothetical protein